MRIPVLFSGTAENAAFLAEGGHAVPDGAYGLSFTLPDASLGHAAGCTCCTPRGPAEMALASMFRARATGQAPFFIHVMILASPAGETAIRNALQEDVLVAARYRAA